MAEAPATGRPIVVGFGLDTFGTGGTELNAVRVAERLDRSRFTLHLFTLQADGPLRDRFLRTGAVHHAFPVDNLWGPSAWRAGFGLRAAVRAHGVQVLHAHDLYSSILMVPWLRTMARRPATIASRRWWNPPSRRHGVLGRLTLPFADRLLVNTPALVDRVITMEGARAPKTVVIPNFLDDDQIREPSAAERAAARQGLGMGPEALVIGIVARLDPVKDHVTLIEAFARIAATLPFAHLLVIGDGAERARLESMVAGLGLSARVTFAGELSNATNLHLAADVSVLCSRHEGFPNSLVEAMGAARPVIASAVGGNLDAVRPEETGLLVPVGDADALAGALLDLLRNPAKRLRMGRAGLSVARTEYSASGVLPRLEALYAELATRREPAIRG